MSKGYRKTKHQAAKEKVVRQRQDTARKWAKAVVLHHDQIAVEDFQAVDAGYITAAHIVTARDERRVQWLGPVGLDTCHENHRGEHFAQSAFTVDWRAKKVTCPAGQSSAGWSGQRKSSGTPLARVHFTAQDCASCPMREKCTRAANGKWGRSLTLLPQDQQKALETRRREQLTDQWQQRYNTRAGVEGKISRATRRRTIRVNTPTGGSMSKV